MGPPQGGSEEVHDAALPSTRVRARTDANARVLLHTEARKLATTTNEVIRMKQWKMKMPRRKTDYQKLKQAAEAIGGGD